MLAYSPKIVSCALELSHWVSRMRFWSSRCWTAQLERAAGRCTEFYTLLRSKVELVDAERSCSRQAAGARAPGMKKIGRAIKK